MVRPKRKEDSTLVVRLGPGDLAHNVLTHSRETNGQRSTAELELKLGIIVSLLTAYPRMRLRRAIFRSGSMNSPKSATGPPRSLLLRS